MSVEKKECLYLFFVLLVVTAFMAHEARAESFFCHRLGIEPSNSTPSLTPYFSLSAISRGSCVVVGEPHKITMGQKLLRNYIYSALLLITRISTLGTRKNSGLKLF